MQAFLLLELRLAKKIRRYQLFWSFVCSWFREKPGLLE